MIRDITIGQYYQADSVIHRPVSYTHLHIQFNPTKVEGICDACGEKLILRDDDKPETVKNRLSVYHEPVSYTHLDVYKRQKESSRAI